MLLLLILFTFRWSTPQRWTFTGRWQRGNRVSGTDHSEKVISITFSANKKESILFRTPSSLRICFTYFAIVWFPILYPFGYKYNKRLPLLYPIWHKSGSKTEIYTRWGIFSLILSDYIYDFPDIFIRSYFLLSITFLIYSFINFR